MSENIKLSYVWDRTIKGHNVLHVWTRAHNSLVDEIVLKACDVSQYGVGWCIHTIQGMKLAQELCPDRYCSGV